MKHLRGPLWEMRMKGRDGISRAIYVTATGRRVVVGRVFIKKTQTTTTQGTRTGDEESEGSEVMTTSRELRKKWMRDPKYAKAFAELAPEYSVARAVIEARVLAGLTQEELAARMNTNQSAIARLESGRTRPTTETLTRLAVATGTELNISFTPKAAPAQ